MTTYRTKYRHMTLELMLNGLVRVFDLRCNWSACYRWEDGSFAHGATDSRDYREAVTSFRAGLI